MNRAPWLHAARRQARTLVDARLRAPRPSFVLPHRTLPVLPLVLAFVITASGAWAWTRGVEPQVLVEKPAPAMVTRRPPRHVDEPFGDVIEVKRPSQLPPLFDVGEYRSRGVMVK